MYVKEAQYVRIYRLRFDPVFSGEGILMKKQQFKIKALFVPYYFGVMNYAVIAGIFRYLFGGQNAAWEKAKRK